MVHIIKVYFTGPKENVQIRRLAVNSEVVSRFDLLVRKIQEMFPGFSKGPIEVTWKDSENDSIHMSSDEELAHALASSEDDILRVYAFSVDNQPSEKNNQNFKSNHNEIHQNVICDGCDKTIQGYRYKCLQCRNFDLCSACNATSKHDNHDMIKLVRPTHIPREWVFPGARKIWRSMFGRCPHAFFTAANENEEGAKSDSNKNQWQGLLDDLLKGGYVSADKLIKDNLGGFLNFIDSVSGNLDVKLERDAPPAKKPDDKTKPNSSNGSAHTEPSFPATPCFSAASTSKEFAKPEMTKTTEQSVNSEKKEQRENPNPCGLFTNLDSKAFEVLEEAKEQEKVDEAVQKLLNWISPCAGENSPTPSGVSKELNQTENSEKTCGVFNDNESEGWTILNKQEDEKSNAKSAISNGAKPKYSSIYPSMSPNGEPSEVAEVNAETKLKEVISKQTDDAQVSPKVDAKDDNADKLKQDASVNCGPEIMNALLKMQAMGFTNEGGWLERLLITKDGNINATLDALYPNTRRR